MDDLPSSSPFNIGDLAKPATALVERVCDAIGGIAKPWQIRRVAEADGDAMVIAAQHDIEVNELQRRAMARFIQEEGVRQRNMESILRKSLPHVIDQAHAENMESDWIASFFEKCRLVSDEEMQQLWAKVLAGEANAPGAFSKRTVMLLSALDKFDAELFTTLCRFVWDLDGDRIPVIYDHNSAFFAVTGINFSSLCHLQDIGLITFHPNTNLERIDPPLVETCSYFNYRVQIERHDLPGRIMKIGEVLFTFAGEQLARIMQTTEYPGALELVCDTWARDHCVKLLKKSADEGPWEEMQGPPIRFDFGDEMN